MIEVAVIDYGAGNIGSLINSLRYLRVRRVLQQFVSESQLSSTSQPFCENPSLKPPAPANISITEYIITISDPNIVITYLQ